QFLAPTLQLIVGVWILGETVPTVRWIGFGIVWIALIMLTIDTIHHARRRRAIAVATDPAELGLSLD
ncbi:MAG TPA: hypothetical protein VEW66_00890, partial [Thermomicrobiales bacterium]|nr:hypothetical protein [Thermomicrobiales bacterium]